MPRIQLNQIEVRRVREYARGKVLDVLHCSRPVRLRKLGEEHRPGAFAILAQRHLTEVRLEVVVPILFVAVHRGRLQVFLHEGPVREFPKSGYGEVRFLWLPRHRCVDGRHELIAETAHRFGRS